MEEDNLASKVRNLLSPLRTLAELSLMSGEKTNMVYWEMLQDARIGLKNIEKICQLVDEFSNNTKK
jgi:hypothetical protein